MRNFWPFFLFGLFFFLFPFTVLAQATKSGSYTDTLIFNNSNDITVNREIKGLSPSTAEQKKFQLINYLQGNKSYKQFFWNISQIQIDSSVTDYQVRVLLPKNSLTPSISKPEISKVNQFVYEWSNLKSHKTPILYLAFSDKAFYKVKLHYSLVNETSQIKQMAIPLIPEGIYQKVYLLDLSPIPENTFLDTDDNYLAIYSLNPGQTLEIELQAIVTVFAFPRKEVVNYQQQRFGKANLSRYLTSEPFWQLDEAQKYSFKNLQAIYEYVVESLEYDSTRLNSSLKRMGAKWVLKNPKNAVCMEFSDLFIALSRNNGFFAREVVGYSYTGVETILPSSFFGDVLHAWPEYYDSARQFWQPVDPTWGKTAKMDYFRSLDLNHIAFVYHGKDTTYPLPPGVYKTRSQTKDVSVDLVTEAPKETLDLRFVIANQLQFSKGKKNWLTFQLTSLSNFFVYNGLLQLVDSAGQTLGEKRIPITYPFYQQTIKMEIETKKITKAKGTLKLLFNNQEFLERPYLLVGHSEFFIWSWIKSLLSQR